MWITLVCFSDVRMENICGLFSDVRMENICGLLSDRRHIVVTLSKMEEWQLYFSY